VTVSGDKVRYSEVCETGKGYPLRGSDEKKRRL